MKKFMSLLIIVTIVLSSAIAWACTRAELDAQIQAWKDWFDQQIADAMKTFSSEMQVAIDLERDYGRIPPSGSTDYDTWQYAVTNAPTKLANAVGSASSTYVQNVQGWIDDYKAQQQVAATGKTDSTIAAPPSAPGFAYIPAEAEVSAEVAALTEETDRKWYTGLVTTMAGKNAMATQAIVTELGKQYGLEGLAKMSVSDFKNAVQTIVKADPTLVSGVGTINTIINLEGLKPDNSAITLIQQTANVTNLRLDTLPVKATEHVFAPVLGPEPGTGLLPGQLQQGDILSPSGELQGPRTIVAPKEGENIRIITPDVKDATIFGQ